MPAIATRIIAAIPCARYRRADLAQAEAALARCRAWRDRTQKPARGLGTRDETHRCDGCRAETTNAPIAVGWNTAEGAESDWLVTCDACREAGEREMEEALGLA